MRKVGEHLWVHQVGGDVVLRRRVAEQRLYRRVRGFHVGRRHDGAGACRERRHAIEHLVLQRPRKALLGEAQVTAKQGDDGVGELDVAVRRQHHVGAEVVGHHIERHVAHDLGGGRDLDDIPEELVDLGIGRRHAGPLWLQAHGPGLFAQVGVLAPGHFVQIDVGRAGTHLGFERRVVRPHVFPIAGDFLDGRGRDRRGALGALQRADDRTQVGLRGQAAQGVDGAVHRIHAGVDRGEHAGGGNAAGVVRMEVDRQAGLLFQRADQRFRRCRPA